MVFESRGQVLEHRSTPLARWLRVRRIRLAFWIAVGEGLLVVLHVIPWLVALLVAVVVVVFYFAAGRELRSPTAREISLVLAGSQLLMVFVPVFLAIVGWLAIIALVVLAVAAVFALLAFKR
jgi:hypothetical protein